MSRQLTTLLWKNFRWCRRHWLWTSTFYLLPVLFSCFLLLVVLLMDLGRLADCDFVSLALPPSPPIALLTSLVCRKQGACRNTNSSGYMPPRTLLKSVSQSNGWASTDDWTLLCPGLNSSDANAAVEEALVATCRDRNPQWKYADFELIDFVFRGRLLYYPRSASTEQLAAYMAAYLDVTDQLKIGNLLLPNRTSGRRAAALARQLGQMAACYQPLSNRTVGFNSRAAALQYARGLNSSKEIVWAVVGWQQKRNRVDYTITTHYQLRGQIASVYLQSLVEAAVMRQTAEQQQTNYIGINIETKLLPKRFVNYRISSDRMGVYFSKGLEA